MLWNAVIFGPEDSPWDGGTFKLTITFSEEYPNKPPVVKFLSKMFHPNSESRWVWGQHGEILPAISRGKHPPSHAAVYNDGGICLDILQNQWSPIYDVGAILTSIQSLLCDPNPNSPANSEAARLFHENRREYNRCGRSLPASSQSPAGAVPLPALPFLWPSSNAGGSKRWSSSHGSIAVSSPWRRRQPWR